MSGHVLNLHASCVVLGEAGLLIRGASGAGKSTLARRLIAGRTDRHGFAALVADDRVLVSRHGGRLVARPHPAIAGLIEHRGFGIRPVPYEEAAVIRLVVDLTPEVDRMPDQDATTSLLGLAIPCVSGPANQAEALIEVAFAWQR